MWFITWSLCDLYVDILLIDLLGILVFSKLFYFFGLEISGD